MTIQTPKRIIILVSDDLLSAGVESFLSNQEQFDVFSIENKVPKDIFQAILDIQPDVIIMDQNNRMINFSELLADLETMPRVRTIVLNLSDNQIQVCERNRIEIHQLSDFLSIL